MKKGAVIKFIRQYWKALRVFSLSLAFASCAYGVLAARIDGKIDAAPGWRGILLIALVFIAGIAAQAGANLINDYFEGSFKYTSPDQRQISFLGKKRTVFDVFVFLSGLAFLGLAALIGIYLVAISGIWMLVIGLAGLTGAYAYTGEPFVYKKKGLGVPLSFLLMGPLMSFGAYYPFACTFSLTPILISLPGSLLIPALMLSNEMRDFSRDHTLNLGTLSVRIGSVWSFRLYALLAGLVYLISIVFVITGIYPVYALVVLVSAPFAVHAGEHVGKFDDRGIPLTGRLHQLVNFVLIAALFFHYEIMAG
ncbi:MAG: prenyltransferase [Spirochaetales bacterium]|nr:prenyltransferase [Spirochaetales bacterium]